MTTMRAVRFSTYGPPSVLSVMEVPKPVPQPGEVLVEVAASAINPSDVKFVSGVFTPTLPRTPGRDYAGIVVAGSARFAGTSVWGNGAGFGITRDGSHAQFVGVPEAWLSEMPGNLSIDQAAAVGVPFVTAWSALVVAGEIRSGDTVLITGASGAVGRAATQIARWKNARVIRADINEDPESSTDPFVNTKTMDLPAMVAALTENKGVSLVLDAVGGPVFEPAMKSMGLEARHVVITSVGSRRVEFDLVDFYHNRQRLIGVDTAKLTGAEIAAILDVLRPGFESGALKPSSVKTWRLDEVVKAYEAVAAGDASVKHVLKPNEV